jgi:hypothetical protein
LRSYRSQHLTHNVSSLFPGERSGVSKPSCAMRSLNAESKSTGSIISVRASTSRAGTKQATPPAISGKAVVSEQITGVPQAMASSTGRPKPSANEGKTNTSAPPVEQGQVFVREITRRLDGGIIQVFGTRTCQSDTRRSGLLVEYCADSVSDFHKLSGDFL